MKVLNSLFLVFALSFLVLTLLPIVRVEATSYSVFFAYYQDGAWQKVSRIADTDVLNATRDTHNRKAFYGFEESSPNFFALFQRKDANAVYYSASTDALAWSNPVKYVSFSNSSDNYGGSPDIDYPNFYAQDFDNHRYEVGAEYIDADDIYFHALNISGSSLTSCTLGSFSASQSLGGSVINGINNATYCVFNRINWGIATYIPLGSGGSDSSFGVTPDYSNSTGGVQILSYRTATVYDFVTIAKNSSNVLAWNLYSIASNSFLYQHKNKIIDSGLAEGFSSFCAASEARGQGDPEIIHVVYIKADGSLLYSFLDSTSTEFASAITLESSGVTSPVINVDDSGNLLCCYIKDNTIKCKTKAPSGSWSAAASLPTTLDSPSGYYWKDPASLSSSHNAQGGKISLIWTGSYAELPLSNTQTWIGLGSPYAYAAITIWSLALIIGVGAVLMKGQTFSFMDLIVVIMIGIGITICLFISLAVLSGFLRL